MKDMQQSAESAKIMKAAWKLKSVPMINNDVHTWNEWE